MWSFGYVSASERCRQLRHCYLQSGLLDIFLCRHDYSSVLDHCGTELFVHRDGSRHSTANRQLSGKHERFNDTGLRGGELHNPDRDGQLHRGDRELLACIGHMFPSRCDYGYVYRYGWVKQHRAMFVYRSCNKSIELRHAAGRHGQLVARRWRRQ